MALQRQVLTGCNEDDPLINNIPPPPPLPPVLNEETPLINTWLYKLPCVVHLEATIVTALHY